MGVCLGMRMSDVTSGDDVKSGLGRDERHVLRVVTDRG